MQAQSFKILKYVSHAFFILLLGSLIFLGLKLKTQLTSQENIDTIKIEGVEDIEQMRSFVHFEQLKRFIETNQSSEAQNKISYINQELQKIESSLSFSRNKELDTVLESYKNISDQLSRLSRPDEILVTMKNKVDKLDALANKKRWKNILKGTERIDQRIGLLKLSGRVESNIVKYMESDITAMTNLIRGSALEPEDKSLALAQLEALQTDLVMLLDLHEVRKNLTQTELSAKEAVTQWGAKAHLALGSIQKVQIDKFQSIIQAVWVLVSASFICWGILAFLGNKAGKDQLRVFENKFLKFLSDLKNARSLNPQDYVSRNRQKQFSESVDSFRITQSLGDDFSLGMPFSSMIINTQGKVEWANPLFFDQFGLDSKINLGELDFKYFSKKIISSQDYLSQALESMEPATWQVQLQMSDGVTVPMEMHLSPIEKDEGKLLVIFYDLVLIKEAIQTQSHLIMHPVRSAFEALEKETWGVEVQHQLAPLWKKAGLEEDWIKLSRVIEKLNSYRFDLMEQVKRLDNEKKDHLKMIIEMHTFFQEQSNFFKKELSQMKKMRDVFISLDQTNGDLQTDHRALTQVVRTQAKRTDFYWEQCRHLVDRLSGLKDSAQNLEQVKVHYKSDRTELMLSKQKLMKLQNEFLMNSPMLSDSAQKIAADMKDSIINLDKAVQSLDKNLSSLDIEITKVAMAFTGVVPQLERSAPIDIHAHEKMLQELSDSFKEDQELMIDLLHNLVAELKSNLTNLSEYQGVVEKNVPDVFTAQL